MTTLCTNMEKVALNLGNHISVYDDLVRGHIPTEVFKEARVMTYCTNGNFILQPELETLYTEAYDKNKLRTVVIVSINEYNKTNLVRSYVPIPITPDQPDAISKLLPQSNEIPAFVLNHYDNGLILEREIEGKSSLSSYICDDIFCHEQIIAEECYQKLRDRETDIQGILNFCPFVPLKHVEPIVHSAFGTLLVEDDITIKSATKNIIGSKYDFLIQAERTNLKSHNTIIDLAKLENAGDTTIDSNFREFEKIHSDKLYHTLIKREFDENFPFIESILIVVMGGISIMTTILYALSDSFRKCCKTKEDKRQNRRPIVKQPYSRTKNIAMIEYGKQQEGNRISECQTINDLVACAKKINI